MMTTDLENVRQHTIRDMDYLADQLRILDVTAFENEYCVRSLDSAMQALSEVKGHPTSRSKTTNVLELPDFEICRRCGASMQATHHELCEAHDGTPTDLDDATVRRLIRQKSIQRGADK